MGLSSLQTLKVMFHKLDPLVVKKEELLDAKLSLLGFQSGLEYNQAMVGYTEAKIKRLTADIQRDEDERHRAEISVRAVESGKTTPPIQLARTRHE